MIQSRKRRLVQVGLLLVVLLLLVGGFLPPARVDGNRLAERRLGAIKDVQIQYLLVGGCCRSATSLNGLAYYGSLAYAIQAAAALARSSSAYAGRRLYEHFLPAISAHA